MDEASAIRALNPYGSKILATIYGYIAQTARSAGAVPVWIFLPQVTSGAWEEETPETVAIARAAGFVVIDLEDIYRPYDYHNLRVAAWDDHPNVLGHQVIADRLYDELMSRRSQVFDAARKQ
jgi:hypothetical protein